MSRSQNLPFFVDNQLGQLPFETDGLTLAQDADGNRVPMLVQTEVNPGVPNTLRLSLGDAQSRAKCAGATANPSVVTQDACKSEPPHRVAPGQGRCV